MTFEKIKVAKTLSMNLITTTAIDPCQRFSCSNYITAWAKGYITCWHKKSSVLEPSTCRGIKIISTLGNVFNSILNDRLSYFLKDGGHISKLQIGFEKGSHRH